MGVFQPYPNKFLISTGCSRKFKPFIFIIFGILVVIIPALFVDISILVTPIFGLLFIIAGLGLCCKMYNNIYFIMGQNNLTIIKKANCGEQTHIYNPGELLRVEFKYNCSYNSNEGVFLDNYSLVVFSDMCKS